jgi:3-oxoacyl-[acyl-carrier protein] reductase
MQEILLIAARRWRKDMNWNAPSRNEDRAALVIGAGGIGGAICRRLAEDGYRVGVADLDIGSANTLAASLGSDRHLAFHVDAANEQSVTSLLATAEEAFDGVAVLVYAAGGCFVDAGRDHSIGTVTADVWDKNDSLNSRGLMYALREFIRLRYARPLMSTRIVFISSMNGVAPSGLHTGPAYAASKAAATNLIRFVALEGGPHGITANVVAPGTILTPPVTEQMSSRQLDAIKQVTPVRKIGRPENIAAAVAYFAEADSDFVTGCVLEVNGGRHMG